MQRSAEDAASRHECPDCGQLFAHKHALTNHRGSSACTTNQAVQAQALQHATVGPDYAALRSDGEHIRKQKILALGRWRYLNKLSHRACEATNTDMEMATTLAVDAYARHFKGMLAKNGIHITPEMLQQVDLGAKVLLQTVSTSSLSACRRETELSEIVAPVPVEEPRYVGKDEEGDSMFVVDMRVEKTLEKMLQEKGLAEQALTPHWPQEGAWREPRDGTVFKNHPLFRNDPGAFAFQLYAGT